MEIVFNKYNEIDASPNELVIFLESEESENIKIYKDLYFNEFKNFFNNIFNSNIGFFNIDLEIYHDDYPIIASIKFNYHNLDYKNSYLFIIKIEDVSNKGFLFNIFNMFQNYIISDNPSFVNKINIIRIEDWSDDQNSSHLIF